MSDGLRSSVTRAGRPEQEMKIWSVSGEHVHMVCANVAASRRVFCGNWVSTRGRTAGMVPRRQAASHTEGPPQHNTALRRRRRQRMTDVEELTCSQGTGYRVHGGCRG